MLLYKGSIHVFLALLCWDPWEGSRNWVGRKARKDSEILREQGGYHWDTGTDAVCLAHWSSSVLGASLQRPSSLAPSPKSLQQCGAELSHATWLNCSKNATKSQIVCQPSTWRSQFCKEFQSWVLFLKLLDFFFSLAVVPALPLNYKPLRKCCVDIVKESDQTVDFLLMVIKRECWNLYWNYTVQWFLGSTAFHLEVKTGLQMFLCEHSDMQGWEGKSLPHSVFKFCLLGKL